MSAKTQHYADLADRTVAEITSDAAIGPHFFAPPHETTSILSRTKL